MNQSNHLNANEGALPSYFPHINASESHPIASWQWLEATITSDPTVKNLTDMYRKRLAVSKKFADELKPYSPAITLSAQMDGYGRQLANFLKPTYLLMVEFDKVPKEQRASVKETIAHDDHTAAVHESISGRGFHLFCRYAPCDDEDISTLELFQLMVEKAQQYYEKLVGLTADKACSDINRCAGLAHDPEAFFRWDAKPFKLELSDIKKLVLRKAERSKPSRRKGRGDQVGTGSKKGTPTIDEVGPHMKDLLEQWGSRFEPGNHNAYVTSFAYGCLKYGMALEDTLQYAGTEFGTAYAETASVVKSVYKHMELFGIWKFYRKGEEFKGKPSVRLAKQWLSTRYEMRRNMVTGYYEVQSRMVTGKYRKFTQIDDHIANSIWAEMNEAGLQISEKTLQNIVNSDFSESYDPLELYLQGLPEWKEGEDPDYIDQLADRIRVVHKPSREHTQELFRYFFKKWMVATVVGWVSLKVVNQFILIFVGKGGIYKTTFFAYLLPPQLRTYFLNDSSACYTDKDFMEAFASKALICLDEFETVFGKNLSALKSCLTKLFFSIRRPYDKYRSELPHRGALCGTTNSPQFISDDENRRYSPWVVESIESPIDHPIDYDHVYAEAVALGRKVMSLPKGEPQEWTFWLTGEDIDLMCLHNRPFMVANYAEEQILKYYRVPDANTDLRYIKFRYTSEILERIGVNPALRQNLNSHNIGQVMSRLGFTKIHKERGNGWAVIEKENAEINSDSFLSPTDLVED